MNEGRKASWVQNLMLLGALAAGTCVTQLVPAYQEHVGKITYPSRASAMRTDAASETSNGFSHTEKQGPKLTIVRRSS